MKQISEKLYPGNQSWNYSKVVAVGEHRLKVSIKRDSYDFQSYARCCRWDGDAWKRVCFLPFEECECKKVVYVLQRDEVDINLFRSDAVKLIMEALEIVVNDPERAAVRDEFVSGARVLRPEECENPEYTRGMAELIAEVFGVEEQDTAVTAMEVICEIYRDVPKDLLQAAHYGSPKKRKKAIGEIQEIICGDLTEAGG